MSGSPAASDGEVEEVAQATPSHSDAADGGAPTAASDGQQRPCSDASASASTIVDDVLQEAPSSAREVFAWYMGDFGNSPYNQVAIGSFIPLATQTAALFAAGFPDLVVFVLFGSLADYAGHKKPAFMATTAAGALFTVLFLAVTPDTYWLAGPLIILSNVLFGFSSVLLNAFLPGLVRGLPHIQRLAQGVKAAGVESQEELTLPLSAHIVKEVSVESCAEVGAGEDTPAAANPMEEPTQDTDEGGLEMVPVMPVQASSDVEAGDGLEAAVVSVPPTVGDLLDSVEAASNSLSNRGFACGYAGGLLCVLCVLPLTIFLDDTLLAYRISIAVAGVWWVAVTGWVYTQLNDRQGAPMPPNTSILSLSVSGVVETVKQVLQLPISTAFLVCWFLLSDGVSVQIAIGALFANSFVSWGCIPRSLGLAAVIIIIPLFGILGNMGTLWASRRFGVAPKVVLQATLFCVTLVPAYALVGMATNEAGLHQGWELFIAAPLIGVASAVTQGYSRAVFVTLIPKGFESAWMSLFELTNKGSSFVGPAVAAAAVQSGNIRLSFLYVLAMLLIPATALFWVDVKAGAAAAKAFSLPRAPEQAVQCSSGERATADGGSPRSQAGDSPAVCDSMSD